VDPLPPIRKTCKRYDIPGHAHFLTFSCFRRQPFLSRDRTRDWLITAILLARELHAFDLWAWVFMPEHVHLLLFPRRKIYSVSAILCTIKQSVSKRAMHYAKTQSPRALAMMIDRQPNGKQSFRFWQRGGGYDHNLWSTDKISGEDRLHPHQSGETETGAAAAGLDLVELW
jgi:putative transposase